MMVQGRCRDEDRPRTQEKGQGELSNREYAHLCRAKMFGRRTCSLDLP